MWELPVIPICILPVAEPDITIKNYNRCCIFYRRLEIWKFVSRTWSFVSCDTSRLSRIKQFCSLTSSELLCSWHWESFSTAFLSMSFWIRLSEWIEMKEPEHCYYWVQLLLFSMEFDISTVLCIHISGCFIFAKTPNPPPILTIPAGVPPTDEKSTHILLLLKHYIGTKNSGTLDLILWTSLLYNAISYRVHNFWPYSSFFNCFNGLGRPAFVYVHIFLKLVSALSWEKIYTGQNLLIYLERTAAMNLLITLNKHI